jgi:Mg2+-importing ATPase
MKKILKKPITSKNNRRNGINEAIIKKLRLASLGDNNYIYEMLQSDENGLTEEIVNERLEIYGPNEIQHTKAPAWYIQLLDSFANPFSYILLAIGLVSFIIDVILAAPGERDFKTIIVVSTMIVLSGILRFIQEFRSNIAAEKLNAMVKTTATVLRKENGKIEIPIEQIVPGDIVFLSAGDMVPADCRVLESKDLFVNESMLTGESMPVEKYHFPIPDADKKQPTELNNLCFMGTNVESGTAKAIVVTTGTSTYFGSISSTILDAGPETSFEKGVGSVSRLLIRFMLVMVPIIFLINGLSKGNWIEAFLFGIAVAVGLTPEMLPMIVTVNLAKGAINMSKRKVVVKRLNAIQNLGAMDILCTDKTGTLTLNKIVLKRHLNVQGEEDDEVLKWAYLNSYYQTGLKNLLDKALLEHIELSSALKVDEQFEKIDEIPFDFKRRRMSVILRTSNGKQLMITKGAVEEVLSVCSQMLDPGKDGVLLTEDDIILPINESTKEIVRKVADKMQNEGLRVLLVAIKEFEENHPLNYTVEHEKDLILTGLIGFLDPVKPSAKPSIEALQKLGVNVKVLTGDNEIVTKKICKDVGIPVNKIILGKDLDEMSDEELIEKIDEVSVFAKLNPMQKVRVVKALRHKGHTVGFLGDGINDASSLKESDVGISVDSAVDIAKESADIILLEQDLMVLRKGVIYGRRTFGNIMKYLKMTVSSNFGNVLSVLGASSFLPFLPMLPIQLLTQNLLYDISQTTIPWDTVDAEIIEKPQKWNASSIKRFMLFLGPISSIFDFITFAALWFIFKANTPECQSLFQTGWFVEGLLSQTLIIHIIRTRKIPFIQSWATAPVLAMTSLIMLIGILIPFSPIANWLKMQPLPGTYFLFLIFVFVGYLMLAQIVKNWYIRRFNEWL